MTTSSPPVRRRSTQAERRAATRTALLDATIECLVTYGYAGTTTGRIAELAGVSRGAQVPYFRSRADLVSAAVAHLAETRVTDFQERLRGESLSVDESLDALWAGHQGPIFEATLELWVAARTDSDLRRKLRQVERDVGAAIAQAAQSALGETARRPGFAEDMTFALATIRGLALLQISHGGSGRARDERWRETRERLARLFQPA